MGSTIRLGGLWEVWSLMAAEESSTTHFYLAVVWPLFRTFKQWHGTWQSYKLKTFWGGPQSILISPSRATVASCLQGALRAHSADKTKLEFLVNLSQLVSFCTSFIYLFIYLREVSFLKPGSCPQCTQSMKLSYMPCPTPVLSTASLGLELISNSFVIQMRKQSLKTEESSLWVT